jgi:hypothetical protein
MKTDGQILRDAGISQSLDNADSKIDNWSNIAYSFLIYYYCMAKSLSGGRRSSRTVSDGIMA